MSSTLNRCSWEDTCVCPPWFRYGNWSHPVGSAAPALSSEPHGPPPSHWQIAATGNKPTIAKHKHVCRYIDLPSWAAPVYMSKWYEKFSNCTNDCTPSPLILHANCTNDSTPILLQSTNYSGRILLIFYSHSSELHAYSNADVLCAYCMHNEGRGTLSYHAMLHAWQYLKNKHHKHLPLFQWHPVHQWR